MEIENWRWSITAQIKKKKLFNPPADNETSTTKYTAEFANKEITVLRPFTT